MLEQHLIKAAARRLNEAEKHRSPIRQFSIEFPKIEISDSYGIQAEWTRQKLADGNRIVGRKIGLTSRAMQVACKIDEPDYGVLFTDMLFADGDTIPIDRFIFPRLEVELAFVLDKPLAGPDITLVDVMRATEYVVPALEIIDSRFQVEDPALNMPRLITDTIADNAASAALVIGGRPVKPLEIDLRWVSALCYQNGVIEDSGVAGAVLNHPGNGVAWLARKLSQHGEGLESGQIILAGSFTRPLIVAAGDLFHVDYGALGSITCKFGAQQAGRNEGADFESGT